MVRARDENRIILLALLARCIRELICGAINLSFMTDKYNLGAQSMHRSICESGRMSNATYQKLLCLHSDRFHLRTRSLKHGRLRVQWGQLGLLLDEKEEQKMMDEIAQCVMKIQTADGTEYCDACWTLKRRAFVDAPSSKIHFGVSGTYRSMYPGADKDDYGLRS